MKEVYEQKKSGYETALEELRAIAIVYRYLGSYRGKDTLELDAVLTEYIQRGSRVSR